MQGRTVTVNGDSFIDRGFYAFMAFIFVVTAAVGFGPNSIAILNGTNTNPPLTSHLHAFAMASWLILLATQATHKRLMFLATLAVVDAAVNRMRFLPGFGFNNPMAVWHTYELLLLVPVFASDLAKLGHIHSVNLIGISLIIGFTVVASVLW